MADKAKPHAPAPLPVQPVETPAWHDEQFARFDAAVENSKKKLEQADSSMQEVITENHKTAEDQEDQLIKLVKASLKQIFDESRDMHTGEYEKARSYFIAKRQKIDQIRQLVEHKYSDSADPRVVEIQGALNHLLQVLVQKEQLFEREMSATRAQKEKDISSIADMAEKSRMELEKKHARDIAGEFSALLVQMQESQGSARSQFETMIAREREQFSELLMRGKERFRSLKGDHQKEIQENRVLVKEKMEFCNQHIRMGDVLQALQAQKELIQFLKGRQSNFQTKQQQMTLSNIESLNNFDKDLQGDTDQLLVRSQELFEQAKQIIEQQAEQTQKEQAEQFDKELNAQLEAFHREVQKNLDQFTGDQREKLRVMKEKLVRQAQDNQRRRKEAYDQIIQETRQKVAELEKRAATRHQRMQEEQQAMLSSASSEMETLKKQGEALYDELQSAQRTLVQTEQKKTTDLIKDIKRNARNQAWEEKLRIAKDTLEKATSIRSQQRDASRENFLEFIEQGKFILEQLQQNRMQYNAAIEQEKEQTRALRQRINARQKDLEAQRQQKVKLADTEYKEKETHLKSRQQEIQVEQERFRKLLESQIKAKGEEASKLDKDIAEFKEMVDKAAEKRSKEMEDISAEIKTHRKKLEEQIEEARLWHQQEEIALSQEHERELKRIQVESAERSELLRKEQTILLQQHEQMKQQMANNFEHARQAFKDEEEKIYQETQRKLQELEREVLGMDVTPDADAKPA
ncbi:hypothetical protein GC177_06570 [bacterium]|nr:hypothetical protein [bacterium]